MSKLFHLSEIKLHGRAAPEHSNDNFNLLMLGIDRIHNTDKVFERAVDNLYVVAFLYLEILYAYSLKTYI